MARFSSLLALVVALAVAAAPFDASAQATGLAIKCINNTTNPLSTALSYFPPNMRITTDGATAGAVDVAVAAGFTVHYDNTFKLVKTICGKYQPAACQTSTSTFCCRDKTYVLTLCGAAKPTTFANGTALPASATHFTIPLTAVATAKGGAVPFMELLGLLDKIAVVDPQTIHSPCLQKLEEDMVGAGATSSPKANWTKLIAEHPTVTGVWTDSFGTGSSSTDKDIVFDGSADASGVLGRAEWIKYMSLFFNEEDKANLYFANEQKVYKATEQALVAVKGNTTKSCAWVQKSWNGKYEVSFATYKVELCKSAGLAAYVNTTLQAAGTSKQVFDTTAEFHAALHTFDVVIDETYFATPSTTVKADVLKSLNVTALNKPGAILLRTDRHVSDKHSKIRPNTTGTVYENVDWLESAIARPALVLQDFAAKVWGVAKSPAPAAGCSQYFRDVLAGEMPIVNGKETCAKFEAAENEGKCITNAVNTRFISSGVTATSGVGVSYTVVVSSILALVAATLVM